MPRLLAPANTPILHYCHVFIKSHSHLLTSNPTSHLIQICDRHWQSKFARSAEAVPWNLGWVGLPRGEGLRSSGGSCAPGPVTC